MVLPVIIGIGASFIGGMYAGEVIHNATEQPDVIINTNGTTVNGKISNDDLIKAGILGVVGYLIYNKWLK